MNIFDILNSVLYSKKRLDISCDDENNMSLYMVNRWMSMYSKDVNTYVNNFTNKYWQVYETKNDQYDFLFYMMPKLKFKKIIYIKKTNKKDVEKEKEQIIPEFLSKREYNNLLELKNNLYE